MEVSATMPKPERPGARLMYNINVRLTLQQYALLEQISEREGIGTSAAVRLVLDALLYDVKRDVKWIREVGQDMRANPELFGHVAPSDPEPED
jgi:hypothetical protein